MIAVNDVRFIVAEQLAGAGGEVEIALEPRRRDSAAAVAAVLARRRGPGTIALVVAADHLISDMNAFVAACAAAAEGAREGFVMTLGVTPHPAGHGLRLHPGQLKAAKRPEAEDHLTIYRPWGSHQRIGIGSRFQVKRITVKPGHRLSLQKHFYRAEHRVVVRGTAVMTIDDQVIWHHETEAAYLPIGSVHRLANPARLISR